MMQVLELKKLKPLINPSLSLLTRSVSGTAKGKGKVKAGQTLKRSVVTTKKGKSPEGEVDPEEKGRGREKDEMARTLEGCLSATSPVRYMKPKEAEREAERERMGLVSKARTKELEMFKKNNNKESEFDSPMLMVGGLREKDEMAKTLERSLSATSPVRYMKPKEAEREAEREKMGLVSKERTKELEMLEKSKNSNYEFDSPMLLGTPGFDLISLGLVDAEAIPKYELTVEDGQRLAKEYSRVLMRKHRARQTAESAFLNLKKEAIEALPEGLKAAALVPDLAPFPKNRFMAMLTPPIEGYIEKINEAARQTTRKAKLR